MDSSRHRLWLALGVLLLVAHVPALPAAQVVLKDGRTLEGKFAKLPGLVDRPRPNQAEGPAEARLILMCDDNLRRYFIPARQVRETLNENVSEVLEKFNIRQRIAKEGSRIQNVGQILEMTPFDEFGHRRVSMRGAKEQINVVQGITEITPLWCRVEGATHVWDQRVATTSIPRETLDAILQRQVDPTKVDQRLKIARLYVQSQRYADAKRELEQIIADFPDVEEQVGQQVRALAQLGARVVLTEARTRQQASQHQTTRLLLDNMPTEQVSGEILQAARELIDQYKQQEERGKTQLQRLDQFFGQITDSQLRERFTPIYNEIRAELNPNTLNRLTAFDQLASDDELGPAEKFSLAASGWLAGTNGALANTAVAMTLFDVRELIAQYLRASDQPTRDEVLEKIRFQEGATPEMVARLVSFMTPPLPLPEPLANQPGCYELPAKRLTEEPPGSYLVQLPPEYDPHVYYPAIVTLHGANTTPKQQLDWWAGSWSEEQIRLGQASRHGYIVIAPAWGQENQNRYNYSASAHAIVLNALRDATRRFSIDTDRVFLSGHSMGGDAAWDIGLAHPDLWAGIIPIAAVADRYCKAYQPNARYVPFYVVSGELDGDKLTRNAPHLEFYLRRNFNVTVAEFIGRGQESFSDEILKLFEWMQVQRRDFFPREFTCQSMRPWDNYFWWVEVDEVPERFVVLPDHWPPPRNARALKVEGKVTTNNDIRITAATDSLTLWLSPQLVDFAQRTNIYVNGDRVSRRNGMIEPDVATLLEDVRTRGDRQHPFWAKMKLGSGT
jgi:pimeloyl-ACP methyl ester carboxylesterase